jgi:hypothetical protein
MDQYIIQNTTATHTQRHWRKELHTDLRFISSKERKTAAPPLPSPSLYLSIIISKKTFFEKKEGNHRQKGT